MDETEGIQPKVKQELSLCAACLSKDRRVNILKAHNTKLFIYLLGQYADLVSPDSVVLCWECSAVLNRICRFQHQVQAAQVALLQTLNPEVEDIQSLSTLITTHFGVIEYSPVPTELNSYDSTPLSGNLLGVKEVGVELDSSISADEEKYSIGVDETLQQISTEIDCIEECVLNQKEDKPVIDDENLYNSDNQTQDDTSRLKMKKSKMKFSEYLDLRKNLEIDLEKCSDWFGASTLTAEEAALGGIVRAEEHSKTCDSCKACRIPFPSALDYHRHNTFWHVLKENAKGPFECEECHERCADKESLRLHWSVHNTILRCSVCRQAVDAAGGGAAAMRRHLKTHAYLYSCTACRLPNATFQKFHDPETLKKKEAPELRYCVECDKEFRSVGAYRKHVNSSKIHNPRYNPKKRDPAERVCVNKNIRDRTKIVDLHQQGHSISEIARELKMSIKTVRLWIRRHAETGNLNSKRRGLKPHMFTSQSARHQDIIARHKSNPFESTKETAAAHGIAVSTVRKHLRAAGFKTCNSNPSKKSLHLQ